MKSHFTQWAYALFYIGVLLLVQTPAKSQNMVFNGSFELYDSLPNETGEWMSCQGWTNLNGLGTPDYAHMDGGDVAQMPHTFWCGVYPQDGNAAMSFKTYKDFSENFREYIGVPLIAPLDTAEWYKVSFWITNGEYYHRFGSATNHIGLLLGTTMRNQPLVHVVDAEPQFEIDEVLISTEWRSYTFYFKPDSAYAFAMMGNFAYDAELTTILFDPSSPIIDGAQYFVDNLAIVPIPYVTKVDTVICFGDSYTLPDGTSVTYSIQDTTMLSSADGLDSLVITNLVVSEPITNALTADICAGDTYTLPDGTLVSSSGAYTSVIPAANGCDSTIFISLTVHTPAEISNTVYLCAGEFYTLPDGNTVSDAGMYRNIFTDTYGCDSTIITTISINAVAIPEIAAPEFICLESDPVFIAALPEGGLFSTGITDALFDPEFFGEGMHTITYTVTSDSGCMSTAETTIEVISNYADAGEDIYIPKNTSAVLDGESGGNYMWSPPLFLSCTDCPSPEVSTPATGVYYLSSEDIHGCIATDSVTVFILNEEADAVWLPNTFTPNGDGMNDVFFPQGYAIAEILAFTIFDRWGERIYHTEHQDVSGFGGWDGTYGQQDALEGVYVFTIQVRLQNNIVILRNGNVTLIR